MVRPAEAEGMSVQQKNGTELVDNPATEWSNESRVTAPAIVTARSSGVTACAGAVITWFGGGGLAA